MNTHDFVWLWQGIVRANAKASDAHYAHPINEHRGGNRRAILLLHGFSSTPAVFRTILNAFDQYDGVVAPLLPGHGESIEAFSKVHAQDWINCAQNHCEVLLSQYQEVDVMGVSLGGLLACHLAAHFKLRHLYLLAPALALTFPLSLGPFIPKLLLKLGKRTFRSQGGNIHSSDYSELVYRRQPLEAVVAVLSLIKTFPFIPPACPTDLFLGSHDAIVASAKVHQLFKNLSNVNTHWLKHSAHILPLDTDRKIIIDCVKEHQ